MKTALPIVQALPPRPQRPSESIEDGRRWSFGRHEFSTAIWMMTVMPAEIDVLELGCRPAVAYCEEFTEKVQRDAIRSGRLLHPVEYPRGVFS